MVCLEGSNSISEFGVSLPSLVGIKFEPNVIGGRSINLFLKFNIFQFFGLLRQLYYIDDSVKKVQM